MFMDISDILKLSDLHRVEELGHCVSTKDGLLPCALSDCVNGFGASE
jgi:hypothetical protein